jgi:NAD(P)-dependent dehydrogenase (short-subunit alcohol dehydrogenase family)
MKPDIAEARISSTCLIVVDMGDDSSMLKLKDKVAVVTGAASGIGLAIADRLSGRGVRVLMTDVDGAALDQAASDLQRQNSTVATFELDVRDADATIRAAEVATDRFGALHIAVNNAGVVNRGLAWELSVDEWRRIMDVNLFGVINGIRAFVPRIIATGERGHVVNVASMAAVLPQERLAPYTVAKHGVLGLSDVLRADLAAVGADIGVSVVMPGKIRTGMNPIGTVEPSVVAANVVRAIETDQHYVFTDDHSTDAVKARLQAILAARDDVIGDDLAAPGRNDGS